MKEQYSCYLGTFSDPIFDHSEDLYENAVKWIEENNGWLILVDENNTDHNGNKYE